MIQLNLDKSIFAPKFFPLLLDYSSRFEVYRGSAGSAKSYFITQKLIIRALNEQIKILVCRRYGSTIRNTCFSLFKDILAKWKLTQYVKIRETDFNIKFPNGSEIIFMGLDDECKLLSLNNIGTIFIEECYEVPKPIVEQLNLRMRGNTKNQQIIMAFNPISKSHWLYDFCEINPPSSFTYTQSTFRDNPFLSKEYVKSLEELYIRNPAKAKIFCDGEWGSDAEGLVFTNWKTEDFDELELASQGLEHRAGADIGWTDPTAIVNVLYDKQNRKIYVFDEFYKSGCQQSEILSAIGHMNIGKTKLYVDSAEPQLISFLKSNSINAVGSIKGKDSVKAGIMFLQDNQIIVKSKCQNLITELENFSYIKDKQTDKYTENTTHEFSHVIDALRYSCSDIYTNRKMKTVDKSVLGL